MIHFEFEMYDNLITPVRERCERLDLIAYLLPQLISNGKLRQFFCCCRLSTWLTDIEK